MTTNLRLLHLRSVDAESSTAARAAWQRTLFAVPEAQRTDRQRELIESIVSMEYAVPILLDFNAKYSFNPDDVARREVAKYELEIDAVKNREMLKAFCALAYGIELNNSHFVWRYYVPEKINNTIISFARHVCSLRVFQEGRVVQQEADFLVPWWISMVMISFFTLDFRRGGGKKETQKVASLIRKPLHDCLQYATPSNLAKCNKYLEEVLGSAPLTAESLITMLRINQSAVECHFLRTEPQTDYTDTGVPQKLMSEKTRIEKLLESMTSSGLPVYKMYTDLEGLDTDMKVLCLCYLDLSHAIPPTHRFWKPFWQTAEIYMKFLEEVIQQADDADDPYSVAVLSRFLLENLSWGLVKEVSYVDFQAVCNDLKNAMEACAAWAPKMWKMEIEANIKHVTDNVIPFLLANAGSKSKSIPSFTRGFIQLAINTTGLLKEAAKDGKKCAHCGIKGFDLMRCSGCQSVWYCDGECQKKGWKSHKVACKRAKNAAS